MKFRFLLPASLALTVFLGACGSTTPPSDSEASKSSAAASSQATSVAASVPFKFIPYTDASPEPGAGVRVIEVEVKNFAFIPAAIALKKGEKVAFKVTSTSGNHSFMAADLGVNVKVDEGQTVYVNIPTDNAGTFTFRCAVPCGDGHLGMIGTIVIE